MRSGGLDCGELESGTTTTVRLRSLIKSLESTRHGRVLLISEPSVGLSRTHQTSPRRGVIPWLGDIGRNGIEFPLDQQNVRILVGDITSMN